MNFIKGHPVAWAYLTVAFVLVWMKAVNYVDYSWWAVTAPLWGPVALIGVLLAVVLAVCVLGLCFVILGLGAAMRTMVEAAAKVAVEHNQKMRQRDQQREAAGRN